MGIGPTEMAIILVIVLIFFGAGKLPEVFEQFGIGMRRFREAQYEAEREPSKLTAAEVEAASAAKAPQVHQHTAP
jgi:sec-independent protein translocase protein TatA